MEIVDLKKAAIKRLSAVEVDTFMSNQHEFNGVTALKNIFGGRRFSSKVKIYHIDSYLNVNSDVIDITWYDARENHPSRSEYRLYYSGSYVFTNVKINDILIVLETVYGEYILIILDSLSDISETIVNKLAHYYLDNYSILIEDRYLEFFKIIWGLSDRNNNLIQFEDILLNRL